MCRIPRNSANILENRQHNVARLPHSTFVKCAVIYIKFHPQFVHNFEIHDTILCLIIVLFVDSAELYSCIILRVDGFYANVIPHI